MAAAAAADIPSYESPVSPTPARPLGSGLCPEELQLHAAAMLSAAQLADAGAPSHLCTPQRRTTRPQLTPPCRPIHRSQTCGYLSGSRVARSMEPLMTSSTTAGRGLPLPCSSSSACASKSAAHAHNPSARAELCGERGLIAALPDCADQMTVCQPETPRRACRLPQGVHAAHQRWWRSGDHLC